MSNGGVERLWSAYEALNAGDPTPLAELFEPEAEWHGRERGALWWRKPNY
jgi:hypothetical protein